MKIADVNGDGAPDVVIMNLRKLLALPGNGAGGLGAPVHLPAPYIGGSFEYPIGITTGDFNGDGISDIALGSYYNGEYSTYFGDIQLLLGCP